MTIEKVKRKNGVSYRAQKMRDGIRASKTFKTKVEARIWLKTVDQRHQMSALINQYIEQFGANYKHDTTINHLLWWDKYIGTQRIKDIKPKLISTILNRECGQRPIFNRKLSALSSLFRKCIRAWHLIDYNPCAHVERVKENKGRIRFLSHEEYNQLLEALSKQSNPRLKSAVLMALYMGMRASEIKKAKWHELEVQKGYILLKDTKNTKDRMIHISPVFVDHIKTLSKNSDWIVGQYDWRKAFDRLLKDSNIINFKFHDLRHTAASYFAMSGASLLEIAEILGHSSLAMVKRYAHLSPKHNQQTIRNMHAWLEDQKD